MKRMITFAMLAILAVAEIGSAQNNLGVKGIVNLLGRNAGRDVSRLGSGKYLAKFEGISGSSTQPIAPAIAPAAAPAADSPIVLNKTLEINVPQPGSMGLRIISGGTGFYLQGYYGLIINSKFEGMNISSEYVGINVSGQTGVVARGSVYDFQGVSGNPSIFSGDVLIGKRILLGDEKIDLTKKVDDLEKKNQDLEARIAALEKSLAAQVAAK